MHLNLEIEITSLPNNSTLREGAVDAIIRALYDKFGDRHTMLVRTIPPLTEPFPESRDDYVLPQAGPMARLIAPPPPP